MKYSSIISHLFGITAGFVLLAIVIGCDSELVPSPDLESIENSSSGTTSSVVAIPQDVTATQGAKQKITLNWTAVNKAVRYYIYAAATPFETYTQIGETTKTNYDYTVNAGTLNYFKITAVNYAGTESSVSKVVQGTSLAQPLISDIEGVDSSEDSSVTVYWYMENVSSETYLSSVHYVITCDDSTTGKEQATGTVKGSETANTFYTFTNLTPSTNYIYTVTAYNSDNDSEVSDTVSAATAKRLRPDAPENLVATEGTATNTITLTFSLPEEVSVATTTNGTTTYSLYPLYFKIYRRMAVDEGETENEWSELVSYLNYHGTTDTPTSYDSYVAGTEISWTDTTSSTWGTKRGVKYEYKVKSYADNTSRVITSDLSSATASGWAAAAPTLVTRDFAYTYTDDATAKTKATLGFTAAWTSFGKESSYKYVIKTNHKKLSTDNNNSEDTTGTDSYVVYDSISSLNATTITYDLTGSDLSSVRGYYTYSLYLVSSDTTASTASANCASALDSISAPGIILVSEELNLPDLSSFAVTNGYADRVIVSFTYNASYTYYLERYALDSSGNKTGSVTTVSSLTSGSYTDTDGIVSGTKYVYTLYATTTSTSAVTVPSSALIAQTLGTPELSFNENASAYKTITATWPEVAQATSYTVVLSNSGTQIGSTDCITVSGYTASGAGNTAVSCSDGTITYVITEPAGYNDASISGKDLTLTVTATSSADSSKGTISATGTTTVRTLGPAATNIAATQSASTKTIAVTWKNVPGAAGYAVQRVRYDIPSSGTESVQKTDLYYVTSAGVLTHDGESVSGASVTISGTTFTLSDTQTTASDTTDGYQLSQSMIAWGVPFEYTVLPVLSASDAASVSDFTIAYTNVSKVTARGSTLGYGQNVTAGKADAVDAITISWNEPCGASANSLQPSVYYRASGSSTNSWTKAAGPLAVGTTKTTVALSTSLDTTSTRCNAYEYAVTYNSSASATFADSYVADLATHVDSNGEQNNKGYEFTIPYFFADKPTSSNESASEVIAWTLYDFTTRKCGPGDSITTKVNGINTDPYTVYCKNKNCSATWYPVATISKTGTVTTLPAYKDWYGVSITAAASGITITPTVTSSATDGLLKVQRDYKHYYKIEAVRQNADGDTIVASIGAFDGTTLVTDTSRADTEMYTYRKITEDEFCRCVSLIIADAINQSGVSSSGNRTCQGSTGTFTITHKGATKTVTWGSGGAAYTHIFRSGTPASTSETLTSGFTIKMTDMTSRAAVDSDKLYYLPTGTITVTHETGLSSYQGTMTFTAGEMGSTALLASFDGVSKEWNVTMTRGSSTICSVSSNETTFKTWFPFDLAGSHDDKVTAYTSTLPEYANLWWEAR